MSDKPIEYRNEHGVLVRVMVCFETPAGDYGGSETDERDATEADLRAAGFVPASQQSEAEWAVAVLDEHADRFKAETPSPMPFPWDDKEGLQRDGYRIYVGGRWVFGETRTASRIAAARALYAADNSLPSPPPAQPEQQSEAGWIPCSRRQPVDAEFVLAYAPARGVEYSYRANGNHGEKVWCWAHHGYGLDSEVTHWRALPAPPSEPAKEGT